MLRDWGSWDAAFNAVTARVRAQADATSSTRRDTHVCVPMQGSGTFSVEAAVNTLVPRDGHVLVLVNGAYGKRLAKLTQMMGRRVTTFETADDVPTTAADVERLLANGCVDHARRASSIARRRPASRIRCAGDRRRRRAARQAPDRRCDELVRRAADRRAHDRRSTR